MYELSETVCALWVCMYELRDPVSAFRVYVYELSETVCALWVCVYELRDTFGAA